jgi:hypothetical protein
VAVAEDATRLPPLSRSASAEERLARLDRLMDLYDAARFGGEPAARDALWAGLGTSGGARGPEASRDVLNRMLQEAWEVEEAHVELPEDQARFLADFINMVSVDLNLPADADSVSIQTAAYRQLAQEGHPRLTDNARWRLYDHVRGVLAAAVEVHAIRAAEISAHVLYAEHEDISRHLEDDAPHVRPERPSPSQLWEIFERQREALGAEPRWRPILEARRNQDSELGELVREALPQRRDDEWKLASLPAGTGHVESLAPVVLLAGGQLTLRPTSPHPSSYAPSDPAVVAGLEGALARDGRGILLLAAEPMLPSPDLHAALQQIAAARVSTVELAIFEPRVDPNEGHALVVLPLQVAQADDLSPASVGFTEARVRVHLTGRGPRFAIDGAWLSAEPGPPSELAKLLDEIQRAYPREKLVGVSLAEDVMFSQLLDLLAALGGGMQPRFAAVGWIVGDAPSLSVKRGDPAGATLDRRARLGELSNLKPELEQPYPLQTDDQQRLEEYVGRLGSCLPELEGQIPRGGLSIELHFEEGHLRIAEAKARKLDSARGDAINRCTEDVFAAFRLREHRDLVTATATFRRP